MSPRRLAAALGEMLGQDRTEITDEGKADS